MKRNCNKHMRDLIAEELSIVLRYNSIDHMLTCDENNLFGKFHLEAGWIYSSGLAFFIER